MFGKLFLKKKYVPRRGPCALASAMRIEVEAIKARLDRIEAQIGKKTVSERTRRDAEELTMNQILNEWLNGKDDTDGS